MEIATMEITMVLVMELKIQEMGTEIRTVRKSYFLTKILCIMHKITLYSSIGIGNNGDDNGGNNGVTNVGDENGNGNGNDLYYHVH